MSEVHSNICASMHVLDDKTLKVNLNMTAQIETISLKSITHKPSNLGEIRLLSYSNAQCAERILNNIAKPFNEK